MEQEVHKQPKEVSQAKRALMDDGYTVEVAQLRRDRLMVHYDAQNDPPEKHIGWIIHVAQDSDMLCHGVEGGTVFLEYQGET